MISVSDRKIAVELIDEARASGARLKPACKILNISERTYQRWETENAQYAQYLIKKAVLSEGICGEPLYFIQIMVVQ